MLCFLWGAWWGSNPRPSEPQSRWPLSTVSTVVYYQSLKNGHCVILSTVSTGVYRRGYGCGYGFFSARAGQVRWLAAAEPMHDTMAPMQYGAQEAVDEAKVLFRRFLNPPQIRDDVFRAITSAIARALLEARAKQAEQDARSDEASRLRAAAGGVFG